MPQDLVTILDDGRPLRVPARGEGPELRVPARALEGGAGDREWIGLVELAARLERPIALDAAERAAWLGVSARERGRRLRSLIAPDFALPDLDGRLHTLTEHRGKKVLLVAYASW
jgi:hypothetical protein